MSKKAKVPKGLLQQQDRRRALAERAVAAPATRPAALPPKPYIEPWRLTPAGQVEPHRRAMFWRPLPGGRVACDLCYRRCDLAPGEVGWCRYRVNRGGSMALPDHGTLARCQRQIMGYQGGQRTFLPGAPALGVGGIRCTARCAYCTSANVVWAPDKLPWFGGRERAPGQGTDWYYAAKGVMHPEGVLRLARERRAVALVFSENEPLLSLEYTYDTARLAQAEGLRVVVYSNGFSEPAAVRKLAPYVDAVDLGIKGSLSPDFYARLMRAPGATEAVQRSLLEWRAAGVHLLISDLIATPHQQPDEAIAEAAPRLYDWIARELGEHTPVLHGLMHPPDNSKSPYALLIPATRADYARYTDRYDWAHGRAKAAGLHYAHQAHPGERIVCHACGGLLLQLRPPRTPKGEACPREAGEPPAPCVMFSAYCDCWSHTQHVTDGKCDHCGTTVPIVTLSREELAAARRRMAETTAAAAD